MSNSTTTKNYTIGVEYFIYIYQMKVSIE